MSVFFNNSFRTLFKLSFFIKFSDLSTLTYIFGAITVAAGIGGFVCFQPYIIRQQIYVCVCVFFSAYSSEHWQPIGYDVTWVTVSTP